MAVSSRQTKKYRRSKKRQAILIGMITVLVVVAVFIYVSMLNEKKSRLDSEINAVQQQIDEESERSGELENELAKLGSREMIEKIAREKLGLFYPDEKILKPTED